MAVIVIVPMVMRVVVLVVCVVMRHRGIVLVT